MKKNDLTGQKFGMLLVKSEAPIYISPNGHRKRMWNCHCDCGNDCVIMGSHLTTNHSLSCGCQKTVKLKPRSVTDLTGEKFGMLTVMYQQPNRLVGKKSRVVWHCKCECGNETDVLSLLLTKGLVKSCGCLLISHAERTMLLYLQQMHLEYKFQYTPKDLYGVGGGHLTFDFALCFDNVVKLLVELDGLQHYKPVAYFGGNKKYEQITANDALKNEWAKNNNISLIRINVSSCKTDKSFVDLYDGILKVHISELTNSLNIG